MQDIELKILIALHRTVNEIDRKTNLILKDYQLSIGQFGVLEALYHKGDLSVGEVQEKILSSSGTITVIINNLEKKGLLKRLADPSDKRKCLLSISEEGKKLIAEIFPQNKAMIIDSMQNLNQSEKQELLELLKKFKGDRDAKKRN